MSSLPDFSPAIVTLVGQAVMIGTLVARLTDIVIGEQGSVAKLVPVEPDCTIRFTVKNVLRTKPTSSSSLRRLAWWP